MRTITVEVTNTVEVTLDETKFTPEFMKAFSSYMWPVDDIEEHAIHLAQMHVRGMADWPSTFIEGYGPAEKMGISFRITDRSEKVI
ncbi:MAG: hypothetical protein M0R48_10585 [Candidatus Omnitrophica bacterium]|nr:hypothetical protein [Candidatus Omnitrophota bacterium]